MSAAGLVLEGTVLAFTVGERVLYRGRWGRGPAKPGTIAGVGEVREGTPYAETVFDVDLDDGAKHWGYPAQFERVPS